MQTSGRSCRENANAHLRPHPARPMTGSARSGTHTPRRCCVGALVAGLLRERALLHTGSAAEYFTWLNAKLDSIEAMPSSRVSLFFKNAS
jgi:hypothetical protein